MKDKHTDSFLPGMLIALLGVDGLVTCAYILQFKLSVALKLELQVFPRLLQVNLIITTFFFKPNYS